MDGKRERFTNHFFIAAALLVSAYIVLYGVMGQGILSHSNYDSYTRQAQSWWEGRTYLPENVTWLELAIYNGDYYVSFPPFPSVVQFVLYPLFGLNTPDNLINTLFGLGIFVVVYRLLMRKDLSGLNAAVIALLFTLGSNLFYLSVTGWVWFSAQTQGFFFTALAVYLMDSRKKAGWAFSFLCLGIAFACRPFNVVYAPLLLYMLYQHIKDRRGLGITLARCIPYVLPLAAMGLAVAMYNYIRFGSLFEFGHNYLPEFQAEDQFGLKYILPNLLEVLKLPGTSDTFWPQFNGTLFLLVNPAYVLVMVSLVRGRFGAKKLIYVLSLLLHFGLTLAHRTMGGWQFGSRYLADMLPLMLVIVGDDPVYKDNIQRRGAPALPVALAVIGIAVNVWGAIWFYTLPVG